MIEHPRQFVRNQKSFGPDRRRRSEDSFDGPNRRSEQTENA